MGFEKVAYINLAVRLTEEVVATVGDDDVGCDDAGLDVVGCPDGAVEF